MKKFLNRSTKVMNSFSESFVCLAVIGILTFGFRYAVEFLGWWCIPVLILVFVTEVTDKRKDTGILGKIFR